MVPTSTDAPDRFANDVFGCYLLPWPNFFPTDFIFPPPSMHATDAPTDRVDRTLFDVPHGGMPTTTTRRLAFACTQCVLEKVPS